MPATLSTARSGYAPGKCAVLNPENTPNGHTGNCKTTGFSFIAYTTLAISHQTGFLMQRPPFFIPEIKSRHAGFLIQLLFINLTLLAEL